MAFSLNRAQLIGNLTRDPEVRQTPSGQSVASFGVATNFSWTDANGQKQEKTEFHNVVAWRKLADICGSYLKKGNKVYVEGKMQTRDWEGEDGIKRYRTEIVADNIIILTPKGQGGSDSSLYSNESSMPQNTQNQAKKPEGIKKAQSPEVKSEKGARDTIQEDVIVEDLPF